VLNAEVPVSGCSPEQWWRRLQYRTIGKPSDVSLREVAARHGVTPDAIRSRDRSYRVCAARQEWMHALTRGMGFSMSQAGRITGRDRTTVLHGVRKHEQRMEQEAQKR
jgi:chromosomal replication initiation ATPase DnaA